MLQDSELQEQAVQFHWHPGDSAPGSWCYSEAAGLGVFCAGRWSSFALVFPAMRTFLLLECECLFCTIEHQKILQFYFDCTGAYSHRDCLDLRSDCILMILNSAGTIKDGGDF